MTKNDRARRELRARAGVRATAPGAAMQALSGSKREAELRGNSEAMSQQQQPAKTARRFGAVEMSDRDEAQTAMPLFMWR